VNLQYALNRQADFINKDSLMRAFTGHDWIDEFTTRAQEVSTSKFKVVKLHRQQVSRQENLAIQLIYFSVRAREKRAFLCNVTTRRAW